jgi:DNA-binding response OmpR family regulator
LHSEPGSILLVDNDEVNRDMLAARLQSVGFEVAVAASGTETWQSLGVGHVDLIVLDLAISALSSINLLRELRGTHSMTELPVIIVSGQSESRQIVEALAAGANDFVTQPIDVEVALTRIRTHLSLKRADEEIAKAFSRNHT